MEVDPNAYKTDQLRAWLKQLGQKVSGNKQDMAERLNKLPFETRGDVPPSTENYEEQSDDYNSTEEEVNEPLSAKELALLKRENDLLLRENEFLKKMSAVNLNCATASAVDTIQQQQQIPLNILKELIPPFDGDTSFEFWSTQVKSVGSTYAVEENLMRELRIHSHLQQRPLPFPTNPDAWSAFPLHNHNNSSVTCCTQFISLLSILIRRRTYFNIA